MSGNLTKSELVAEASRLGEYLTKALNLFWENGVCIVTDINDDAEPYPIISLMHVLSTNALTQPMLELFPIAAGLASELNDVLKELALSHDTGSNVSCLQQAVWRN